MEFTQHIKWTKIGITTTTYDKPFEKIVDIMKDDLKRNGVIATWLEDENGKELAYFDGHIQLIKGEKQLKKATKEQILDKIYFNVSATTYEINQILEQLEKQGYIKFKKEPKEYKVFVKIVSIGGENKKLYYVTDFHLTENIDEAKRFGLDENKDGYEYEYVKEY